MKTHRIVTIGSDSYVLPESFSNEDSLRLLNFLGGCRKVSDHEFVPDAESRYGHSVLILGDQPVEVMIKITASPLMAREEYEAAREKGQAAYDAAHPDAAPANVL